MFIISIIIIALIWGYISRMCGGGWPKLPLGLDQWLYSIPHGVLGFIVLGWWGVLPAYAFAFIGKRTGHGQYFDMGTSPAHNADTGRNPERLDFIVRLLMGPDVRPSYRRDYVGMVVTGLFITLGSVGVLFYAGYPVLALLVASGGMFKGAAYWIGLKMEKPTGIEYNKTGEFFTGFVDILCVGLAVWALLTGY